MMSRKKRQQQWSNTVWEDHAYKKVRQRGGSRAEANKIADKVRQANEAGQKKGCIVTALALGTAAWQTWRLSRGI